MQPGHERDERYVERQWHTQSKLTGNGIVKLLDNSFAWESFGPKDAQPLLLLHGTSLNRRSYHDVVESLAENSNIVSVDIRGHGESWDGCPASYTTPQFADDISRMIGHFWPGERVVVVGASVSGLHAIEAAHKYPDAIKALILVDILPTFDVSKIRGALTFTSKSFESIESATQEVMRLFVAVPPADRPSPERIRQLFERFLTPSDSGEGLEYRYDKNFLNYLFSESHEELWTRLESIPHPLLLLTAGAGSIVPNDALMKLADLKPHSRHIVIPGSRHSIMHDQPILFSEAIKNFITSHDSASCREVSNLHSDRVEAAWVDALARLRANIEQGKVIIAELLAEFELREEGYHNLKHLSEMLDFLYSYEHEIEDMASIILAVLAHDRVYDPTSMTNEEDSADWATMKFSQLGIPEGTLDRIRALIRATKVHLPVLGLKDSEIFLDADLSILSAPYDRYLEYAKGIRHEYSHRTIEDYCRLRSGVLQTLISRDPFYFRGDLYPYRAELARQNLAREIKFLLASQNSSTLDFSALES